MNERIQELFKRAGGKTSARNLASNPVQVVETHELWDDRIEKFAELIVADCVKIIEGYCETSPEIYGLPLDILEHFDMELKDENT